jgi:hypothetical protein
MTPGLVGRSIGRALLAVLTVGWELAAINAASDPGATSPEEVRFLTADCGVVDQCGLAYRPRSRPTGVRYAHIAGPWYLIQEPF